MWPRRTVWDAGVWESEMNPSSYRHIYGPVLSRRLGHSLGVDLVPFKTCTYDCIYCQLGRTTRKTSERREYVPIGEILAELERKLNAGVRPDYISLAGSGEPTLNARLGELMGEIKRLTSIPVAVLTNGSLLWMEAVQDELMEADLILPSLDAGDENLFKFVNRPHPDISFDKLIDGLARFRERFPKPMWLEVFLLAGITGIPSEVRKIAAIADRLCPERVQLNAVCRPPVEEFAYQVSEDRMEGFTQYFSMKTEVISQDGRTQKKISTPSAVADAELLALLSRRPCTAQDISAGLGLHLNEAFKLLQGLCEQGSVKFMRSKNKVYYVALRKSG